MNVYRVSEDVEVPDVITDGGDFHTEYFVAWFMAITTHCVC
jgi:hypothetical protein